MPVVLSSQIFSLFFDFHGIVFPRKSPYLLKGDHGADFLGLSEPEVAVVLTATKINDMPRQFVGFVLPVARKRIRQTR